MEEKVLEVMRKSGEAMKSGDIAKILGVDTKEVSNIMPPKFQTINFPMIFQPDRI